VTPQLAVEDEVGAELEDEDAVGVLDLVHLRQPLLQLRLGDVGAAGVLCCVALQLNWPLSSFHLQRTRILEMSGGGGGES